MKKIVVLFVIMFSSFYCKAQTWSPAGASWHYGYMQQPPNTYGYLTMNYVNDTVINSVTYKKLIFQAYGHQIIGFNPPYNMLLLNDSSNLIRLYNFNTATTSVLGLCDTLFNFNANIGDKWLRNRAGDPYLDVTRRTVSVLDTGSHIINSIRLKRLVLDYEVGGWPTATVYHYTDTVYEKIGSIFVFLDPKRNEHQSFVFDGGGGYPATFRCYSDNNFALYQKPGALNCLDIVSVNEQKLPTIHFNFYPNPTSSIINIVDENNQLQNATILIKNYLGQVVFSSPFTTQINLHNLSTGMYFLTVEDKTSKKTFKIIKE